MRKLAAVEVVALVASMVVGSSNGHATEPPTLPTVSVDGVYSPIPTFLFPISGLYITPTNYIPSYVGPNVANAAAKAHAMNCALQYAAAVPGANGAGRGPAPGWSTYLDANAGFAIPALDKYAETLDANTPPPPIPGSRLIWQRNPGISMYGPNQSLIFLLSATSMSDLINTIAHEWAHQWGALDLMNNAPNDAYKIGDDAEAAYLKDNGAKCGGTDFAPPQS